MFHGRRQTVSVSWFYKVFNNPIEVVQFASQAGAFQPRNVGDGTVIGVEVEARQAMSFISKGLENFNLTINFTWVESKIELSKTEKESREINARENQTIGKYRDMAGQAPWIINGGFEFRGETGIWSNFQAGIYYNVQGRTLLFSGIANQSDIYTIPFHSLNFNLAQRFGKQKQYSLGLGVENLTNDKKEAVYQSFKAKDQFFFSLEEGTTVSLKLNVDF